METKTLTQFDGGMTNDPRDPQKNRARVTRHFDNYTRPRKLSQHPDQDFSAPTDPNTAVDFDSFRIQQFLYANSSFYGLGVQSGTTKPAIYTKSAVGSAWALGTTTGDYASMVALASAPTSFILYQNSLYGQDGAVGSRSFWKYGDITGTPTWTRNLTGFGTENLCPPIVHSKDDIMYFGYGSGTTVANRLGKNDSGTFTAAVLVFPTYSRIASLTEYQNYLGIAVNNPNDTTNVYFWDRDSSLATLSEKIDWGSGTINFIANIGGTLVGCSTLQGTGLVLAPKVVFKYYNGVEAVQFAEFDCSAATIYSKVQNFNNICYFMAEMTIDGATMRGIWKIVKTSTGLRVSFDRQPRLDDTITAGKLYGFLRTGDYFHVACANTQDGDKYIVTKTINAYTGAATYETTINPDMSDLDAAQTKKLISVGASYEALPSGASVIVSYRVDGGSWTPIFTETTTGTVGTEPYTRSSTGNFTDGQEYEFRIVASGGAEVTGLTYRYAIKKSNI